MCMYPLSHSSLYSCNVASMQSPSFAVQSVVGICCGTHGCWRNRERSNSVRTTCRLGPVWLLPLTFINRFLGDQYLNGTMQLSASIHGTNSSTYSGIYVLQNRTVRLVRRARRPVTGLQWDLPLPFPYAYSLRSDVLTLLYRMTCSLTDSCRRKPVLQ